MKPEEILERVKAMIGDGNLEKAKDFMEEHKEDLGGYYDQAKEFIEGHDGDVDSLVNKVKGLFGGK